MLAARRRRRAGQPARRLPLLRGAARPRRAGRSSSRPAASTPSRRWSELAFEEAATRFELAAEQAVRRRRRAGIAEDFPLDGLAHVYGATKLAAELLLTEYDVPWTINRCGVVAGPWQMGKVDQGVFTHWMLRHHFGRAAAATSATAGRASRSATCCTSTISWTSSSTSSPSPATGPARPSTSAAGAQGSLSLLETTALCRELTGREVPISAAADDPRRRRAASTSRTARALFAHTDWRPRRGAARDAARTSTAGSATTKPLVARHAPAGARPLSHAHRHRHRLRRPHRLRVRRATSRSRASTSSASTTTCARTSSAPRPRRRRPRARLAERAGRSFRRVDARHPRPRGRRARCSPSTAGRSSSSSTPRRSRRTTGRRASRTPTSRVNAVGTLNLLEAARDALPRRDVRLHLDEQGLRRPPELPAAGRSSRRAGSCPRTTSGSAASRRRCRIDRCTHSLFGASKVAADVLVQEYGRYFDMPTVCFRGGCLTGPAARRRAAARLPRLPDAVHGHGDPYTIFGYKGKQVRDNIHAARRRRAPSTRSTARRARPRSTTSAAGARRNVSMLEAIAMCERDRRAASCDYTLSDEARIGDHQWCVSDLAAFERDYPAWELTYGIEDVLQDIHDVNVERWTRGRARDEALGRHPRPQRGGLDRPDGRRAVAARLGAEASTTRSSSSTTPRPTARRLIVRALGASRPARALRRATPYRNGFGFAVRAGLEAFTGDAVAIVMADLSDHPDDLVAYYRLLEAGYDCAFGSRFMRRRARSRLPAAASWSMNRLVNLGHPPASSATATTTRPTRSRPTAARSSRASSRCSPTTST